VGGKAQLKVFREAAGALKLAYTQFEELENFARFGARLNEDSQKIIERGRRIRAFLQQPEASPITVAAQITILSALTNGLLDSVPLLDIQNAQQAVTAVADNFNADLIQRISSSNKLSDEDKQWILKSSEEALLPFSNSRQLESSTNEQTTSTINAEQVQ
jgi:F-type H+-transporting ATPase subunit alpha